MKKRILSLLFSIVFLTSCTDGGIKEVVLTADPSAAPITAIGEAPDTEELYSSHDEEKKLKKNTAYGIVFSTERKISSIEFESHIKHGGAYLDFSLYEYTGDYAQSTSGEPIVEESAYIDSSTDGGGISFLNGVKSDSGRYLLIFSTDSDGVYMPTAKGDEQVEYYADGVRTDSLFCVALRYL